MIAKWAQEDVETLDNLLNNNNNNRTLVKHKTNINESFLAVQPHIDVMASLLFVNINGIPVMYAVFQRIVSNIRPDDDPLRVETCCLLLSTINTDVFDVLISLFLLLL